MKIFLAHAFRDEDKLLVADIRELFDTHSIKLVTGKHLGGQALTPAVRKRIESCDALVALMTRRDPLQAGGWTTHPWVQEEFTWAHSRQKHVIALVEDGVAVAGMFETNEHIDLDKASPAPALLELSETLNAWAQAMPPPRWSREAIAAMALALLLAAAGFCWHQAAGEVADAIAEGEVRLRDGSYGDALPELEAACARPWVGRAACFVRDKAALGAMLEVAADGSVVEDFRHRFNDLRAKQPETDPDLLLFGGALRMRESDPARRADAWREAAAAFRQAIDLRGGHFPEARFQLGDQLLRLGDFRGALDQFNQALAPDEAPDAPHILNARAYAHYRLDDLKSAEADLRRAADGHLFSVEADLAPLLWRSGRFAEAAERLDANLPLMEKPMSGRNLLPWSFDLPDGRQVNLTEAKEKRCYLRLARQATAALQGVDQEPNRSDCGPNGLHIAHAVAQALTQASRHGMPPAGTTRAQAYARRLQDDASLPGGKP